MNVLNPDGVRYGVRALPSRKARIVLYRFQFHRFNRTFFLPLCLLAYLLIGQGAVQNFVLCFGVDGHIAVESAPSGTRCEPFLNMAPQGASSLSSIKDIAPLYWHCGPCLDLSISAGNSYLPVYSVQNRMPQVGSFLLAVSLSPLSTYAEILPEVFLPQALSTNHSFLASLRSVVLLI